MKPSGNSKNYKTSDDCLYIPAVYSISAQIDNTKHNKTSFMGLENIGFYYYVLSLDRSLLLVCLLKYYKVLLLTCNTFLIVFISNNLIEKEFRICKDLYNKNFFNTLPYLLRTLKKFKIKKYIS